MKKISVHDSETRPKKYILTDRCHTASLVPFPLSTAVCGLSPQKAPSKITRQQASNTAIGTSAFFCSDEEEKVQEEKKKQEEKESEVSIPHPALFWEVWLTPRRVRLTP